MTYTARLNRKINGAARVRVLSMELQERDRLNMLAAKAAAYLANHPAPRALFLVG
jgi:hypothetical protein